MACWHQVQTRFGQGYPCGGLVAPCVATTQDSAWKVRSQPTREPQTPRQPTDHSQPLPADPGMSTVFSLLAAWPSSLSGRLISLLVINLPNSSKAKCQPNLTTCTQAGKTVPECHSGQQAPAAESTKSTVLRET